ncbi:MAG: ROK family protein [Acidimicrobiales bacterium]|nr:ROK family protein [Acidimicrobiales bacterium]
MVVLGIDIGGSGIKAAPVDIDTGRLVAPRHRIVTPSPAEPDAVAGVVVDLVRHFDWHGPVGCTFPGVVKAGHTLTAANLGEPWVGLDVDALLTARCACPVTLMNDADAAGLAEVRFGAGAGRSGVVLLLTLGTGIGSALFHDGVLVPNTELGHLQLRGKDAEQRAAARVRDEKKLTWKQYAELVNEYLALVERALWPDLIIIGGGVSAKAERWFHLLHTRAELLPAALANNAGIVGAALWTEWRPDRRMSDE